MLLGQNAVVQFVSGVGETVGQYPGGTIQWEVYPHIEYPLQTAYGKHKVYRPLIGGHNLNDVSISGGVIDGGGAFWYVAFAKHGGFNQVLQYAYSPIEFAH